MDQANTVSMEKKTIYEKIQQDAFTIIGIDVVTSNKDDKAVDDINTLWQRFATEQVQDNIPGITNKDYIFAIYTDYEGDNTQPFRLVIGCQVETMPDKLPEGMVAHTVPSGAYALFRARGEQPRAIIKTWETVWGSDLKREFTSDFEVYGPRFYEAGLHEALINIAIKD